MWLEFSGRTSKKLLNPRKNQVFRTPDSGQLSGQFVGSRGGIQRTLSGHTVRFIERPLSGQLCEPHSQRLRGQLGEQMLGSLMGMCIALDTSVSS